MQERCVNVNCSIPRFYRPQISQILHDGSVFRINSTQNHLTLSVHTSAESHNVHTGTYAIPATKMLAVMVLFEILTRKFYRVTNKHYFILQFFFNDIKFRA